MWVYVISRAKVQKIICTLLFDVLKMLVVRVVLCGSGIDNMSCKCAGCLHYDFFKMGENGRICWRTWFWLEFLGNARVWARC